MATSSLLTTLINSLASSASGSLSSLFSNHSAAADTISGILTEIMQDKSSPAIVTQFAQQIIQTASGAGLAAVASEAHALITDAGNPALVMADVAAISSSLASASSGVSGALSKLMRSTTATSA